MAGSALRRTFRHTAAAGLLHIRLRGCYASCGVADWSGSVGCAYWRLIWLHNYIMRLNSIGEVIAARRLSLIDEPNREILVKMGKPQKTPSEEDFFCPFQITGIGDERVDSIVGIDAFQAIQLTLQFIGGRLMLLNRENGGRLRWECDEKGGFGFPVPDWAAG